MGSLPNLHELERVRRKLENEHEHEHYHHHDDDNNDITRTREQHRTREQQRESSRERERMPIFLHPPQLPYNQQLLGHQTLSGIGIGVGVGVGVGGSGAGAAVGASAFVYSGGTPGQIPKHHHRHSLTSRRVLRTRSSGATYNIWDDPMIEHMAAYSPISSRAHRINILPPYQLHAALAASSRRRESINSSIGANSIRRLLTLNNRSCRHKIPPQVKAKICKNFTFVSIAHGLMCAILIPLIGLQASNSIWHHKEKWVHVGPNIGSMLISIIFLISSGMCFLTTRIIRKIGFTVIIIASYIGMCLFLLSHLYPSIYTLIPAYVVLGITFGPAWVEKIALIVYFASKLSCNQQECSITNAIDALDEHRIQCERDKKIRRLGRLFQAAQDIGIILGAIIAGLVLTCTSSNANCFNLQNDMSINSIRLTSNDINNNLTSNPTISNSKVTRYADGFYASSMNIFSTESAIIEDMYNHNEQGQRICGADLCPVWRITEEQAINGTFYDNFVMEASGQSGMALIIVYLALGIISLTLACLPGRIDIMLRNERVKGMTDTLLFAGPMAYFIGTEQAYMLGDFTRAFVSCSLGLKMVAGALVGMGIMQSIVSCTLSMLLRHTKRIVVIAAGFFFHACLLLVLSRWKPSKDDSALFYVIAAAWGACNAMWETLLFALVTLTHTNHVAEVIAPLQALRFLGLGVTFAAHGFLCENPKILILVIVLVVSVPPYTMLEIRLESQRKAQLVSL